MKVKSRKIKKNIYLYISKSLSVSQKPFFKQARAKTHKK